MTTLPKIPSTLALLLGLVMAACATAQTSTVAPVGAASAPVVRASSEALESLEQRLRQLRSSGVPPGSYSLGKAQCWLDTARTQYAENDRSSYVEESLQESVRIIQALEADKRAMAGFETPLVARSTRLRDDLWAGFAQFKAQTSTLACAGAVVACGEIRLVRAGHAEQQIGWRTADVYIELAEDALVRAKAEAARCAPPVVAALPPPPVVVKAPVMRERHALESDALFRFGESGAADMLPTGQEQIRALAETLKTYQSIERIRVVGHTDRLGTDAYNDRLSLARAVTVKAQLERLGVKAVAFEVQGVGKREPVATGCSTKLARSALIACLQPDRRVTIEVTGIR